MPSGLNMFVSNTLQEFVACSIDNMAVLRELTTVLKTQLALKVSLSATTS